MELKLGILTAPANDVIDVYVEITEADLAFIRRVVEYCDTFPQYDPTRKTARVEVVHDGKVTVALGDEILVELDQITLEMDKHGLRGVLDGPAASGEAPIPIFTSKVTMDHLEIVPPATPE